MSPAPAENFGTRPPAIVIRSPVRGLTPWRGPRSATLNLPKPVKLISPPPVSVFGDPVEDGFDGVAGGLLAVEVAGDAFDELSLGHCLPPGLGLGSVIAAQGNSATRRLFDAVFAPGKTPLQAG